MDPLNAVSLAAAVVQFTDFSIRILSETVQVYNSASGMTSQVVELKTIGDDLQQLYRSIQDKSARLADPTKPLRESEQNLLQLCGTCQKLSDELAGVVAELQTHRKGGLNLAIESFGVAMKKFWSRDYIADLRSRVSDTRQEMMLAMTVFLWENSKSEANNLDPLLRQQTETIGALADATRTLNQTLVNFMQGSSQASSQVDRTQQEIVETIWSSSWNPKQPIRDISDRDIEFPGGDSNINNDAACSKAILNSLFDEELRYREVAIPETYKSTFQWLLNSPRSDTQGRPLWSDFPAWLRNSNTDIYWMTGKPGSGKSTLMKFIIDHAMLRELLAQWSGTKPFILATCYLWNAGTPLQRTQEGLLRTLLYQCLSQQPQLIPKVCPRRWALFKVFGGEAVKATPCWGWEELHESFSTFDLLVGEQSNLALFIDGLDEFDGNHQNLINFIRLLHSRVGRKICVSGRPLNVFQDEFATSPSLRLEILTASDIQFYVQDKLEWSRGFQEYKAVLPQQSNDLVETIVTKAEGVFLWVSVVVLSILEGLIEGDQWEELYDMVNLLPVDLSQLYHRIWSTIKPDYVSQASHLFQIHEAYSGPIDVTTMWLADHVDPLQIDIDISDYKQEILIIKKMTRRLNSRTRGLLEISPNGNIEFLHKSVRDWIEPIWADIVAKSKPAFDPNFCIFKAKMFVASRSLGNLGIREDYLRIREDYLRQREDYLRQKEDYIRGKKKRSPWSRARSPRAKLRLPWVKTIPHSRWTGQGLGIAASFSWNEPRSRRSYDRVERLLWSDFLSCLGYASRVRDIAPNTSALVTSLDRLYAIINLSKIPPPLKKERDRHYLGRALYYGKRPLRRLTTENWHISENESVRLAARFGIIGYVRDKVTASPRLLKQSPSEGSILANAVLGPGYFLEYDFDYEELPMASSHARFLLVKFLLDFGVRKSSARSPGMRTSLYREAIDRPVPMSPIVMPNGERLDYWDTVTKLLEEYGLSGVLAF